MILSGEKEDNEEDEENIKNNEKQLITCDFEE